MNKRRLLALAAHLDTISPRKFNMNHWANSSDAGITCGSTACALGYAGLMPSFRKAGLKTEFDKCGGSVVYKRSHNSLYDIEAGASFFNITEDEAQWLFMPRSYPIGRRPGPKTVASRIRRMVRDGTYPKSYKPPAEWDNWG